MRRLIAIVQAHMDTYGVSEAEVARRIGALPQTVNTWRNGDLKQLPKQQYLRALADLTGTDYSAVLTAALADTGYLAEPLPTDSKHAALIVSLAVDADDLVTATSKLERGIGSAEATSTASVVDLIGDVHALIDAVQGAAAQVVGGDEQRLRRIKREIRRYRRENADLRNLDIAFHTETGHPQPGAAPQKRRKPTPGRRS
jgi:transcriptional regulator with XRE-family HTH domain